MSNDTFAFFILEYRDAYYNFFHNPGNHHFLKILHNMSLEELCFHKSRKLQERHASKKNIF